ncbi:M20/M25/M40 family metallo-hydrolase [Pseudomonas sp. AF03-9]|uniref:M20/M25/M40 family metallo-hydrolase n=1 Tax=Pseudomonas sp. AF03-9 TaxID=2849867 RepID=UPI001CFC32C0|nr:M20/M25/M40 family metallo-hydrolase [Pseudomonas sp. AF03-9]
MAIAVCGIIGGPLSTSIMAHFAGDFRSRGKNVGVMHACGHDAHMAMALEVAEVLAAHREQLPGTLKLIFQPAEEGPPLGEQGGAQWMIKDGALQRPPEACDLSVDRHRPCTRRACNRSADRGLVHNDG